MNPVTGPFVTFPTGPFSDAYRRKFKQAKPYNLCLEYQMYEYYGKTHSEYSNATTGTSVTVKNADYNGLWLPDWERHVADTYNRAYARLQDKIGDRSGWAENIAQAGKARDMFNGRAEQLSLFAQALRHGSPRQAFDVFLHSSTYAGWGDGVRHEFHQRHPAPRPGNRQTAKSGASMFLEGEYGWRPMWSDLMSSWETLNSDPGTRRVYATCSSPRRGIYRSVIHSPNGGFNSTYRDGTGTQTWRVGADVRVSNPNFYLLSRLGIIDIALPFKLIPYSFVLNWFVNIEQKINSFQDWFGLAVTRSYNTSYARGAFRGTATVIVNGSLPSWERTFTTDDKSFVEMRRTSGIPGPSLIVKPFKGFSVERGAQAIALLVNLLKS